MDAKQCLTPQDNFYFNNSLVCMSVSGKLSEVLEMGLPGLVIFFLKAKRKERKKGMQKEIDLYQLTCFILTHRKYTTDFSMVTLLAAKPGLKSYLLIVYSSSVLSTKPPCLTQIINNWYFNYFRPLLHNNKSLLTWITGDEKQNWL